MKIYISHSSGYDFENELYAPLKDAFSDYEVFYPHESQSRGINTKDIIAASDVVLAEVSHPSTGQGIELGWADGSNVSIICFHQSDMTPSGAIRFISDRIVGYDNGEDMVDKLRTILNSL